MISNPSPPEATTARRARDLGTLRQALDAAEASVVVVRGVPGSGKSALVRSATEGLATLFHVCPPLPDPDQRRLLRRGMERWAATVAPPGDGDPPPPPRTPDAKTARDARPGPVPASISNDTPPPDWATLFARAEQLLGRREGRPGVLVLDDAHRLSDARSRFLTPLRAALTRSRDAGVQWHVVLVAPADILADFDEPAAPVSAASIRVGPLPFTSALPRLPGSKPADLVRAYAVFGGLPAVLSQLDPSQGLMTNLRRLVLDPGGPLHTYGMSMLERWVQRPSRYAAILTGLATGEREWGDVQTSVSDLTASGQVAPYLKRLQDLGWVEARRSLDARPRSRNRRYRIVEPLLAFWFGLAQLCEWDLARARDLPASRLRALIDAQADAVFRDICRQHMIYAAVATLGRNARECGSLWGPGYEFPAAGILTSGAAFYGAAYFGEVPPPSLLADMDASVRETRYGFGREVRLRIVFTARRPPAELSRAVARRDDAALITLSDMIAA